VPDLARRQVTLVLQNGEDAHPGVQLKGSASCRLCDEMLGSGNLNAFGFVWPEKADHYVTAHDVWTPGCEELLRAALAFRPS
jgi:hypothetical protein